MVLGSDTLALSDGGNDNVKANFDEQNYSFALTQSPISQAPIEAINWFVVSKINSASKFHNILLN